MIIASVSPEQIVAYGLAMRIRDILSNTEKVGNFGILVTTLTHFDQQELIVQLGEIRNDGFRIRLALADESNSDYLKSLAIDNGFSNETFATDLLAAGQWRNEQGIDDTPIAIAYGEQPTLHTLAAFTSISSSDVAVTLLKWAAKDIKVNSQHQQLFLVLVDDQFAELHNPYNVARYLSELINLEEANRLEAVREYLPLIGLLRDPEIFGVSGGLKARVKENLRYGNHIRYFPPKKQKEVAKRLTQFEETERNRLQNTLRFVQKYQRTFSREYLQNLTLTDVKDLISLKPEKKKKTDPQQDSDDPLNEDNEITKERELHSDFAESILDGDVETRRKIADAIEDTLRDLADGNSGASLTVRSEDGELNTQLRIDKKLLNFVHVFCNEESWGGAFDTEQGTLRAAIDQYQYNESHTMGPEIPIETSTQDLTLRKLLIGLDGYLKGTNLTEAFDTFWDLRQQLLPMVEKIVVAPLEVIGSTDRTYNLFVEYISAYGHLLRLLQENYQSLSDSSRDAVNIAVGLILSVDVVLVRTSALEAPSNKAILMPLHALHLWKYIRLIDIYQNEEFSDIAESDRDAILAEATTDRHFLHTLFVSEILSEGQTIALPFAGSIGSLPCYENTTNHYSGTDGLDKLFYTLNRFIAFYPLFARPLRVAIVDVPDVGELLAHVGRFLNDNDTERLQQLEIHLYFSAVSEARNYLASITSGENESIYQEFVANGGLRLNIYSGSIQIPDLITQHSDRPVHVIALFDQSELEVRNFQRQELFLADSPFCITREYRYDSVLDTFSVNPVNDAELFSSYNTLINQLRNNLSSYNSSVVGKTQKLRQQLDQLLKENCTQWVFLADRVLPAENRLASPRIFAQRNGRREVLVLASTSEHFARELDLLLKNFNLYPQRKQIEELLLDFSHMVGDGLLSVIQSSDGTLMQNKAIGLIGMLVAARAYKHQFPDSLITAIDNEEARKWLRISDAKRRADLVGLRYEEGRFIIDAIEVKSMSDESQIFVRDGSNLIDGKAVQQLLDVHDALRQVFAAPNSPLTPPRREALKGMLYAECQNRMVDTDFRSKWSERLKELFEPDTEVHFGARIYQIDPKNNRSGDPELLKTKSNNELLDIVFVALGERQVQQYVTGEALPEIPTISSDTGFAYSTPNTEIGGPNDSLGQPVRPQSGISSTYESKNDSSTDKAAIENDVQENTQESDNSESLRGVVEFDWLRQVAENFITACKYHDITVTHCDPNDAIVGLSVVRFPFRVKRGTQRGKLDKRLEDIGRDMMVPNLGTLSIQTVQSYELALDVPHPHATTPNFIPFGRQSLPPVTSKEQLPVAIGVKPTGEVQISDLQEIVHMLVGGTTGAGKTIFLFSAILSLLQGHPTADDLELVLCSPKFEDFSFFEGLPHLFGRSVITSAEEAITIIGEIANEVLPRRSQVLADNRVRSVVEFNQRATSTEEKLRPIVIIVDEFADLSEQVNRNRVAQDELYSNIRKIAQAGRSRSVHLILCTQRPTSDLFPSSIKALMNARIALKMNSATDSRTILDEGGAENLLGRGDMLFRFGADLERLQGFYVDTSDLT